MKFESPSSESSTPKFGPTHEVFSAIDTFTQQISKLQIEVAECKRVSGHMDVICTSYKDLRSLRIVFLVICTVFFVLSAFVVLYTIGSKYGELDWIIKLIAGSTGIGLLIECYYLPNKIKEQDKLIAEHKANHEKTMSEYKMSQERIVLELQNRIKAAEETIAATKAHSAPQANKKKKL